MEHRQQRVVWLAPDEIEAIRRLLAGREELVEAERIVALLTEVPAR